MYNSGRRGKRASDGYGTLSLSDQFNQNEYPIPVINSWSITDGSYNPIDDTSLDPAGGQTIVVYGSGFRSGITVNINGSNIGVVTLLDQGRLTFTSPALSSGTYTIYVSNTNGATAIYVPGLVYSPLPAWQTPSAGSIGSSYERTSVSNTFVATGDAPITYSILSGNLPTGVTLSTNGVLSGTAPADSGSTTYSFTIRATDGQGQDSDRSFSLTINTDVVTWSSPASGNVINSYEYAAIPNTTAVATSAAGFGVLYSANAVPDGVTVNANTGLISGTVNIVGNTDTRLTATANTTGRSATRDIKFNVQQDVVTITSPANGTTYTLTQGAAIPSVTLVATSAAGFNANNFTANTLPTGLTLTGNTISGTPTVIQTVNTLITATSNTTNRSGVSLIYWSVLVGGDQYFNYTTLLLSADRTVLSANSFISNASNANTLLTVVGDTRPSNFNPYQQGYYGVNFATKTDYLSIPATTALTTFTGAFTFEAWIYPSDTSITNWSLWDSRQSGASAQPIVISINPLASPVTGQGRLTYYNGTSYYSTGIVYYNQWTHVAVVRSGSTMTFYLNGVASGTATVSGTQTASATSNPVYIGSKDSGLAGYGTVGYISNFRIVNGTAVYTSNFTPSTSPLTAIANTVLLTCQDNRFKDNSTNNYTLTSSNTAISGFNPFGISLQSNTTISTYGSGYFDGTGDYLTIADNTSLQFGTGNFTIECWVNQPAQSGTYNTVIGKWGNTFNTTGDWSFRTRFNSITQFAMTLRYGSGWYDIQTNVNVSDNSWHHLAIVRDSATTIKLYVDGVLRATQTISASDIVGSAATMSIGGNVNSATNEVASVGYISNVRIVKGTAVYTSDFTPSTVPLTSVANTVLLTLQTDIGYNNSTFRDDSYVNSLVSRFGNATQGTFSPYGDNWSNYFDGTGDYLSVSNNVAFDFGTGDFTVELWANHSSIGQIQTMVSNYTGASNGWIFQWRSDTTRLAFGLGDTQLIFYSFTPTVGTWYHYAVTRSGTSMRMFINGALVATVTNSSNLTSTGSTFIGNINAAIAQYTYGYLSNIRIVKGTALYTGAFTPSTTPLTAVANTSLLTCQSNAFIDNSPNNFTITRNGDVTVQEFNPFPTVTVPKYYSAYFDGNGDWITGTTSADNQLTGDFTIECWAYPTTIGSQMGLVTLTNTTSSGSNGLAIYFDLSNKLSFWVNGNGGTATTTATYTANQWYHIALVRSGSTNTLYVNGVSSATNSTTPTWPATPTVGIGRLYNDNTSYLMTGYISNVRIVKGTAVYTGAFTPSTTPLTAVANTILLTCQSNRFFDNSNNNFVITVTGNTIPSIVSPFTPTASSNTAYSANTFGGSIYFDGTGDYLTVPYSPLYNIPASTPMTFESWVYTTSSSTFPIAGRNWNFGSTGPTWSFHLNSGVTPQWGIAGSGSATYVMATSSISGKLGQWNHYAWTRDANNVVRLFVNGVLGTSRTDSRDISSASGDIFIGTPTNLAIYASGYIAGTNFVLGATLYTSNFYPGPTPPTPSIPLLPSNTATANTSSSTLLLNGTSGAIIDATRGLNFETVGNTAITTVNPYAGGGISYYFDGTGDYLQASSSVANPNYIFTTGNFTIEFWFNAASTSGTQNLFDSRPSGTASTSNYSNIAIVSGSLNYYTAGANPAISGGTVTAGVWTHVALTRSGTSTRLFINGSQRGATYTDSQSYTVGINRPIIGTDGNSPNTNSFTGYISDLRVTKGYARYTSNNTTYLNGGLPYSLK